MALPVQIQQREYSKFVPDANGDVAVRISGATLYAVVNTAAAGQASVVLDTGNRYIGLASVNIGGTLPALSAGSNFVGLATVIPSGSASIAGVAPNAGKTFFSQSIALNATNLSGATAFVSASAKNWYITNLILSNASSVGIALLNGPTYLIGNASLRMSFPAQGGIGLNGSTISSLLKSQAVQTDFKIITDNNTPVVGIVGWYEE